MKKTFVLTVSKNFLAGHPKKGQPTDFKQKILSDIKLTTIRNNYDYWSKIIDKVNAGEAILSVREWSGKPYKSKQVEICQFDKLGKQRIKITKKGFYAKDFPKEPFIEIDDFVMTFVGWGMLSKNDGFDNKFDFINWFPNDFEGIIIHFDPKFKY